MSIYDALTDKQRKVYEFIKDRIHTRGYGPTVREIGEAFDISSPNGVMCHLRALEKKGLITREPNMSRAIQLSFEPLSGRGLPLSGTVAAGTMHEAVEQKETIDFGQMFNRADLFVLGVKGDSMIDAQIADGDYVVVRKSEKAKSGEMVVARTGDGDATLKYWFPERGQVRLQPANSSMKPMYSKDAQVVGVVVGVVRKLD